MSSAGNRCVVVGYDGCAASERALEWALHRAGAGRVVVVHAARHQPDPLRPRVEDPASDRLARARAVAELPFLERSDLYDETRCDVEVRDERPATALLAVAAEVAADEIVVGSRHLGRLRSVTGSVCSDLLQRTPLPVVVIP
jgi:nucleotide-binding universal stress UspA family protein